MRSPRVLVVDDEDTIRHILKQVLAKHECEIREAASAEEAIRLGAYDYLNKPFELKEIWITIQRALETYEEALRLYGHQVTAVDNPDAALARFADSRFDLVITDLSMPGMSGLELAEKIKRQDAGIPVIQFSGWAVQQNAERVRQAGVDEVLVKPCLIEDLLDSVRRVTAK